MEWPGGTNTPEPGEPENLLLFTWTRDVPVVLFPSAWMPLIFPLIFTLSNWPRAVPAPPGRIRTPPPVPPFPLFVIIVSVTNSLEAPDGVNEIPKYQWHPGR